METQRIKELFDKYLENQCSAEEIRLLVQHAQTADSAYFNHLVQNELYASDHEGDQGRLKLLADEAYARIDGEINPVKKFKPRLVLRTAVAIAAAISVITLGLWLYRASDSSANLVFISGSKDIEPGKNAATLTLANGKKIRLTNANKGIIASEAGVVINQTADGQLVYEVKENSVSSSKFNTLSTSKGETFQVRLPDGSLVYLNAASSLTYSTAINNNTGSRKVTLTGEGYFEVSKNKDKPFIVESSGHKVEVLGTHFNINSYADETAVKTTVLEGAVRVNDAIDLKPNQQSVWASGKLAVINADAGVVAWTKGKFSYYETPLSEVMKQVARWYDVAVLYPDGIPERRFTGDINRDISLSETLRLFKFSGVRFEIDGKNILVLNK